MVSLGLLELPQNHRIIVTIGVFIRGGHTHTHTQEGPCENKTEEEGNLQAKERSLKKQKKPPQNQKTNTSANTLMFDFQTPEL